MAISNTQSAADAAFASFNNLVETRALLRQGDRVLTEADTRAKLIDPLFKLVLGWGEAEIRREEPVAKGYVDYLLGSDYSHLLIEAKRAQPRFALNAQGRPRRLKLSGPHLLGHKKVREVVHQAQGYASDLGVQFCLVTNGSQMIVFRPYVPGRSWKTGMAIVFHDHEDIRDNFAEFFQLLSRDQVIAGSLVEAFDHAEKTTTQLFAPLSFIADSDRELVRNSVWNQIARTMGPLLTDQADDLESQLEVIRNCYVTTSLGDETDKSLDSLLRDSGQSRRDQAKFVTLRPGTRGKTAFSHRFAEDVYASRRGAYILTGGVGSGKTTFLRRFADIVERDFVREFAVWIHVDFLPIGNVDPARLDGELRAFVYRHLRAALERGFGDVLSATGEALRELFATEIERARRTLLYGVPDDSPDWRTAVNQLIEGLYANDERFVFAAFERLRSRGRRVAIVFDNTDQLGEAFQEKVFLFAQKVGTDYSALCVVTLREEKFFAAYRRGIFDAFGDRRFHIGAPSLKQVLRKRLEYGRQKFAELEKATGAADLTPQDFKKIDALLRALVRSAVSRNANIVRMLSTVSNGDMRHALDMFRDFVSSGNTDVEKIIRIVEKDGGYDVPFHEFAKSAILGSRRYFKSSVSHFVNVFKQSDALGASHMTACRILARLCASEGVASLHGEGFVMVSSLVKEYRDSFGLADDLVQWCAELVRRSLIESEPPRVSDVRKADAIRVSAAGAYYWRYLARAFAYIDLVLVDTPVADVHLARRLAGLVEMGDMTTRFERVRAFLEFLTAREGQELAGVSARGGPFHEALMPKISAQIEAEICLISKKTGWTDIYRPTTKGSS